MQERFIEKVKEFCWDFVQMFMAEEPVLRTLMAVRVLKGYMLGMRRPFKDFGHLPIKRLKQEEAR